MGANGKRTRLWLSLHGWCALPIWLLLLFVCITGTLATIDNEILWLLDPGVRATNPDALAAKPINHLVEDVARQIPGAHVSRIRFGEPYLALQFMVSTPDTPSAIAWVNPYTGVVQKVSRGINFHAFISALHASLLMPRQGSMPIGWYAVTGLSLPLLMVGISGVIIHKKFWRLFLRPHMRLSSGARVAWGDAHRLAGAWSIWFVILMALTGGWFLVRGVLYDLHIPQAVEAPDIPRREAPLRADGAPMPSLNLDGALAAVQAQRPGSQPVWLMRPEHALGTIAIYSRSAFPLLLEQAWVHPYGGELVSLRHADVATTREIINGLNASLHFGNFGGLPVKLVWALFGLLMSLLVLSGTVIWTKRTAAAARALLRPKPVSESAPIHDLARQEG